MVPGPPRKKEGPAEEGGSGSGQEDSGHPEPERRSAYHLHQRAVQFGRDGHRKLSGSAAEAGCNEAPVSITHPVAAWGSTSLPTRCPHRHRRGRHSQHAPASTVNSNRSQAQGRCIMVVIQFQLNIGQPTAQTVGQQTEQLVSPHGSPCWATLVPGTTGQPSVRAAPGHCE